jgi:hypothetical protein
VGRGAIVPTHSWTLALDGGVCSASRPDTNRPTYILVKVIRLDIDGVSLRL